MKSLQTLIEYGHPLQLSRNLRRILLDYMEYELRTGIPLALEEALPSFNYLLDFLEEAGQQKEDSSWLSDDAENRCPGIISASLHNNKSLYRAVAFIAATVQPERIYKIEHRSLQPAEDPVTDLMIILPKRQSEKPFSAFESLIETGCLAGQNIRYSLHQFQHVAWAIADGHPLFSLYCNPANLIYQHNQSDWPETSPEKKGEAMQKAANVFQQGFIKALAFFEQAQHCRQQHPTFAAFFLQQAAELCFRAMLLALSGQDKKTHELNMLVKNCSRFAPFVKEIFDEQKEEDVRLRQLLEAAYLGARYEENFALAAEDLDSLFEKVTILHREADLFMKQFTTPNSMTNDH